MTELQALQQDKLEALEIIKKSEKIKQLKDNPLFKELFLEEYCVTNATRLVDALSNIAEEHKPQVFAELEAISRFKSHISLLEQMGLMASKKIIEIDEAIEEIHDQTIGA